MHHQHKFALAAFGRLVQPARQRLCRQCGDRFILLGQLARQRHRPLAQQRQRAGQCANAMRGFQQHHRTRLLLQRLQRLLALLPLGGQKTRKHPASLQPGHAIAVLRAFHARRTQCGDDAAGSGKRHHAQACGLHRLYQHRARIADCGGACIAHIGHALPLLQAFHHLLRRLLLIVLVQRQQARCGRRNPVGAQQLCRMARILAGDGIGQLQHMQRTQRDIGQIADRRGHQIERAGGI